MGFFPNLMRLMNPNLFNPTPVGNDLPEQGGITGMMPRSDNDVPGFQQNIVDPITNPITQPLQPGFEDSTPVTPMFGGGEQVEPDNDFIKRRMAELYTPEHEASDRFNALVAAYPHRQQPGFMRRLSAALIGAGGTPADIEESNKVKYRDYYNDVEDWKNQVQPLSQAATLERYMNSNERTYANNEVSRELQQREIERKENRDKTYAKDVENKDEARRARLAFNYYKQQHPNHIYKTDGDGYVYSIDPQTDQPNYITDINGDMVKSDKLPEGERIRIQQGNEMARIRARGDEAVRNTEARGAQSRATNAAKPIISGKANAELGPKDLRQVWQNRMTEAIAEDPNNEDYFDTSGGEIRIIPPSSYFDDDATKAAKLKHAKELRDRIFAPVGPTKGEPDTKPGMVNRDSIMGNSALPPPQNRVIGKVYTLKNGKKGKWNGTAFEEVQ